MSRALLIFAAASLLPSASPCPAFCCCDHHHLSVDCSHRRLPFIPTGLGNGTLRWRLDNNCIRNLASRDRIPLPNQVEHLALEYNLIGYISPGFFDVFPKLEVLSLHDNRLTSVPPATFNRLPNLQLVFLRGNPWDCRSGRIRYLIHWLGRSRVSGPSVDTDEVSCENRGARLVVEVNETGLEEGDYDLPLSPTTSITTSSTSSTTSTTSFEASGICRVCYCRSPSVQCSGRPAGVNIPDVPGNTRYLSLTHGTLGAVSPKAFERLSDLRRLDLSSNRLASLPADAFAGLSRLRELLLSYNRLRSLGDGTFAPLSNLKQLGLDHNRLRSLPVGLLSPLGNLRFADLADNLLTDVPDGSLDSLTSLEGVSLGGNPWRCECRSILYLARWLRAKRGAVEMGEPACASGQSVAGAMAASGVVPGGCESDDRGRRVAGAAPPSEDMGDALPPRGDVVPPSVDVGDAEPPSVDVGAVAPPTGGVAPPSVDAGDKAPPSVDLRDAARAGDVDDDGHDDRDSDGDVRAVSPAARWRDVPSAHAASPLSGLVCPLALSAVVTFVTSVL